MKKFSKMTYDKFTTIGEVYEGLPLHKDYIDSFYSLNGDGTNIPVKISAINNQVSSSNPSVIMSSNNISIANNTMVFAGNASSYIEINNSIIYSEMIELNFKIKVSNMSSDMTLISMKNNSSDKSEKEFTIKIDKNKRMLVSEMWNTNGHYTTVPDLDPNGTYSLSDSGAINPGVWYTIKICKYNDIITCHINDILTKSLICQGVNQFDKIILGQSCSSANILSNSFNGIMEYVSISNVENQVVSINAMSVSDDFTVQYDWTPDLISQYNIVRIGSTILAMSDNDTLKILDNMNVIGSCPVVEGHTYRICTTLNRANKDLSVFVYNRTIHSTMCDIDVTARSLPSSSIQVFSQDTVRDLAVSKKIVDRKFIEGSCKKKFSMNKDGNIYYDMNETDSYKRLGGSTQYHFQLSDDLDSDCKTVTSSEDVSFCEEGVKSGIYNKDVLDLTVTYMEDAIENSLGWDRNLHHKTFSMQEWSSGYNSGVENATQGYHAKWVKEGIDTEDICLKMINCNSSNRWMGVNRIITPAQLWSKCRIGDTLKVVFKARADIPAEVTAGYYRHQFSTNSVGFGESLKSITINSSSWSTYVHEYTIDSDWDLTRDTSLYFYGNHTRNATVWIQDICIIRNGEAASSEVILDDTNSKVKIPFSKTTNFNYSGNWSINYRTKILSLDEMHVSSLGNVTDSTGIKWSITKNQICFNIKNKQAVISGDFEHCLNEWITINLSFTAIKADITVCTSKGIFSTSISNHNCSSTEGYNSNFNYDLMLGGVNNTTTGCALFKDLTIIKNATTDPTALEQYFRTKISYRNNSITSNVDIEEAFI